MTIFAAMIQHFLDYIAIERKYSPRTVEAYRDDLRDFCRFIGCQTDDFDPKSVDETDVKTWMLDMIENQHQKPRSVKRRLSAPQFLPVSSSSALCGERYHGAYYPPESG